MRHDGGLASSPPCAIYWRWRGGATKIDLDDAKAALSEPEAGDLVVQDKAPAGANSSTTSAFAARGLDARTPPAPYHHDANGIWAGAYCIPGPTPCPYTPECVEGSFSEARLRHPA